MSILVVLFVFPLTTFLLFLCRYLDQWLGFCSFLLLHHFYFLQFVQFVWWFHFIRSFWDLVLFWRCLLFLLVLRLFWLKHLTPCYFSSIRTYHFSFIFVNRETARSMSYSSSDSLSLSTLSLNHYLFWGVFFTAYLTNFSIWGHPFGWYRYHKLLCKLMVDFFWSRAIV